MKHLFRSYVPELSLLEEKQTGGVWVYEEACALLDRATLTPLAYRGDQGDVPGSPADFAAFPPEEQAFFIHALDSNQHFTLHGRQGTLIVLRHLEPATGLLLALRYGVEGGARQHLLRNARQMGFALSPACQRLCHGGSLREQEQHLAAGERLKQLCGLLTPRSVQVLPQRILHLASFAGISLDVSHLPLFPSQLSTAQQNRLLAFLLCLFFTLRRQNGRLDLEELEKAPDAPPAQAGERPLGFRMEWCRIPPIPNGVSRAATPAPILPLALTRPCFSDFHVTVGPEGLAVELTLPTPVSSFRAGDASRPRLLLRLIPIDPVADPPITTSQERSV
ncbi:MAG: hypothetical protein IJX62_07065 [Clostridia bacterium]|nr:hypothetical protein [Clostridia bacterium]